VPVDHAVPDGPMLSLRVARHRALGEAETAVFQLAGGPGGSSVAQAGIIPALMPRLRERFDLVYVDQRGTGDSGYMSCRAGYPETGAEWAACAREHEALDLDHFLSVDAAHDLDVVRARLGYERIYVRGGSYGTRLGIEYARQHGDRILAMVLDGADPPDSDFLSQMTQNFDRGVELLVADCAADAHCNDVAPDLGATIDALRLRANEDPRAITAGGGSYVEDEGLYLLALRYFVEDAYFRFRLPRALVDALGDRYTRWDALLSELFGVTVRHVPTGAAPAEGLAQDSYVAPGLYMTVTCAESLPNAPGIDALRALGQAQKYGDDHLADLAEACAALDVQPIAEALRQPVVSSVPALVLSGALDINTIPEWGDQMVATLENGHHVVIPDATHSVMVTTCGARIIEDYFLAGGDFDAVDVGCADTYDVPFE
jgi:pimeloyl-ACP methyl ester carboxylesterase